MSEAYAQSVTVADWNRDGHLDIVLTDEGPGFAGRVFRSMGDGLGGFTVPQLVFRGQYLTRADGADVDLDGWPDVTVTRLSNALVLRNGGDGTLQAPDGYQLAQIVTGRHSSRWGEVSGDGLPDLVTLPLAVSPGRAELQRNLEGPDRGSSERTTPR